MASKKKAKFSHVETKRRKNLNEEHDEPGHKRALEETTLFQRCALGKRRSEKILNGGRENKGGRTRIECFWGNG